MRSAIVLLILAVSASVGCAQADKKSLRRGHVEIVNAEAQAISFLTRCNSRDSFSDQTLESHEKAEYECGEHEVIEIRIKTNIAGERPKQVTRTLEMESRNEL